MWPLGNVSFRVSLEFPIHPLLVSDSGQGSPIRHVLVSDPVLLWFPNRFPSVSDSRLGFGRTFWWFPIRLSLGFRVVFLLCSIRVLGFRFDYIGFRWGVSDLTVYSHLEVTSENIVVHPSWCASCFGVSVRITLEHQALLRFSSL